MSLKASLLSGYNTIGERLIKEKCKEQRIGKTKSIGRYTVWKFTSYTTSFSKAESCWTSSLGRTFAPRFTPFSQTEKCSIICIGTKVGLGAASLRKTCSSLLYLTVFSAFRVTRVLKWSSHLWMHVLIILKYAYVPYTYITEKNAVNCNICLQPLFPSEGMRYRTLPGGPLR